MLIVFSLNDIQKNYIKVIYNYKKFKNPEISFIFNKILVPFIICDKRDSHDKKIIKEEESI